MIIIIVIIVEWNVGDWNGRSISKLEYICHSSFGIVINFILHFDR